MQSTEAVLNNRFIRVHWYRDDGSEGQSQSHSQQQPQAQPTMVKSQFKTVIHNISFMYNYFVSTLAKNVVGVCFEFTTKSKYLEGRYTWSVFHVILSRMSDPIVEWENHINPSLLLYWTYVSGYYISGSGRFTDIHELTILINWFGADLNTCSGCRMIHYVLSTIALFTLNYNSFSAVILLQTFIKLLIMEIGSMATMCQKQTHWVHWVNYSKKKLH